MKTEYLITNRRIDLDIAKGIGIILVVWAHALGPFTHYIGQFHMPFFFFISGILYSYKSDRHVLEYIKRKYNSLVLPFWWWNLLFFPIFYVLYYWKNWSVDIAIYSIGEIIFTVNKVPFLGATWFLPALFWVSISVHLFVHRFGKYKYCNVILFALGVIVCIVGFEITFPYRISRTLICSLYYICGYLYKNIERIESREWIKNFGACICMLIFIYIASINTVSLGSNVFQYKFAYIIGAFMATLFILRLSKILNRYFASAKIIKQIIYMGQNSIYIVIWHLLAFRIIILLQIIIMKADISAITAFPIYDSSGLWWVGYLIVGLYGSLLWKHILEHNPLTPWMKKNHMI